MRGKIRGVRDEQSQYRKTDCLFFNNFCFLETVTPPQHLHAHRLPLRVSLRHMNILILLALHTICCRVKNKRTFLAAISTIALVANVRGWQSPGL
jgi:hypothetical protein